MKLTTLSSDLIRRIVTGSLQKDFDKWDRKIPELGMTVAHLYVTYNSEVPDTFTDETWAILTDKGTSVISRYVSIHKTFPRGFKAYGTRNGCGCTIAHTAVVKGLLSNIEDWTNDIWFMTNEDGLIVIVAYMRKYHRVPASFTDWSATTSLGVAVAKAALIRGLLPKYFTNWDVFLE